MNLLSAQNLASKLFAIYKLKNWSFQFDRAKRRFGCCNFSTKTISLSRALVELNPPQKVRDTLLHEIAHALVGPRQGHNSVWREKVLEIGGEPNAHFREEEIELPQAKLLAICPHCQKTFPTFRKRKNVACRACCLKFNGGKFSKKFLLEFRAN